MWMGGFAVVVRTPEPVFPTVGSYFKMIGVSEICKAPTVVFRCACDPDCHKMYQEIALNVTFPLLSMVNGYEVMSRSYPWMPLDVMITETLFLEQQDALLRNVSSWYPHVDLVSVRYSCVFHPFNCVVTYAIENASVVTVLNVTGPMARGADVESLKEYYYGLSNRWTKICEKVRALDTFDAVTAIFVVISEVGKMFCLIATETPVRYTLTLSGEGLRAISVNATIRANRTVVALIINQTSPDYDFTRVNCSISSPFGWNVEIERRIYADVRDGLLALGFADGDFGFTNSTEENPGAGATETRTHVIVPVLLLLFLLALGVLLCLWLRRYDDFVNRFRKIPRTDL